MPDCECVRKASIITYAIHWMNERIQCFYTSDVMLTWRFDQQVCVNGACEVHLCVQTFNALWDFFSSSFPFGFRVIGAAYKYFSTNPIYKHASMIWCWIIIIEFGLSCIESHRNRTVNININAHTLRDRDRNHHAYKIIYMAMELQFRCRFSFSVVFHMFYGFAAVQ